MPEEERKIEKVLVAYDGSENADLALRICTALRDLFGYALNLLYVGTEIEKVREKAERHVKGSYEFHTADGFPEEEIVSYAKANGIDMLFMGAYGKSRFREFFLGSITSFVVYNLSIPLLLAKRHGRFRSSPL